MSFGQATETMDELISETGRLKDALEFDELLRTAATASSVERKVDTLSRDVGAIVGAVSIAVKATAATKETTTAAAAIGMLEAGAVRLMEQRRMRFVGRDQLFANIEAWSAGNTPDRPAPTMLLLLGEPGVGKSSFIAELVLNSARPASDRVVAHHICTLADRRSLDPALFIAGLVAQLARNLPGFKTALLEECGPGSTVASVLAGLQAPTAGTTTVAATDASPMVYSAAQDRSWTARAGVQQHILAPLARLPVTGKTCLVVVDSLDEALLCGGVRESNSIVGILTDADFQHQLPRWLCIVASCRLETRILGKKMMRGVQFERLAAADESNLSDIRQHITAGLDRLLALPQFSLPAGSTTDETIDEMVAKSGGNFLWATKVLDDVCTPGRIGWTSLGSLPAGLCGYYQRRFEVQFSDLDEYHLALRPVFALIIALGTVTRPVLSAALAVLGWPNQQRQQHSPISARSWLYRHDRSVDGLVTAALAKIEGYLRLDGEPGNESISLHHKSLADWLSDPDSVPDPDYRVSPALGHAAYASLLLAVLGTGDLPQVGNDQGRSRCNGPMQPLRWMKLAGLTLDVPSLFGGLATVQQTQAHRPSSVTATVSAAVITDEAQALASCVGHMIDSFDFPVEPTVLAEQLEAAGCDITIRDPRGWTALMLASKSGHWEACEVLIAAGADVNASGPLGWTALSVACLRGGLPALQVLARRGADVDASVIGKNRSTPLMMACQSGFIDVVGELLAFGCSLEATRDDGWTALMIAAQNGHRAVLGLLVDAGADVEAVKPNGRNALFVAAQNGHADIIEDLGSACGTDPNAVDNAGGTALMLASLNGHADAVTVLLRLGAAVNATNDAAGADALMMASRHGHKDVASLLLEAGAGTTQAGPDRITTLMIAVRHGHTAMAHLLVAAGADLHATDAAGNTALMHASATGHREAVATLIEAGAPINGMRADTSTALMLASDQGHLSTVVELIGAGANVDCFKKSGRNALMIASRAGHTEVTAALLKAGADPNVCNATGRTALMYAAQAGCRSVAQLLIRSGGEVDRRKKNGKSALMFACSSDRPDLGLVDDLVRAGADVDACKGGCVTPLMVACIAGQPALVKALCDAGANTDRFDEGGWTPLLAACQNNFVQVVAVLILAGCDVNAKHEPTGMTALALAVRRGQPMITNILREAGADDGALELVGLTMLISASAAGDHKAVDRLLTSGEGVNVAMQDGWTALMSAAHCGQRTVVDRLVAARANVNGVSDEGVTALMLGVLGSQHEIVASLLAAGADPAIVTRGGWLALDLALSRGCDTTIALLRERSS